jgi:hypothetical protein
MESKRDGAPARRSSELVYRAPDDAELGLVDEIFHFGWDGGVVVGAGDCPAGCSLCCAGPSAWGLGLGCG